MANRIEAAGRARGVCRLFWSFHRLAGESAKRVYLAGLVAIALVGLVAIAWSVGLALKNPGGGAGGFFVAAAIIGVGLVVWRFACALAVGLRPPRG